MTGDSREIAVEPLRLRQAWPPVVGIFLDLHTVFIDHGHPIPINGDQAKTICGVMVTLGPLTLDGDSPTSVVPYVQDCPYCTAILDNDDTTPTPHTTGWALCLRRRHPDGRPGLVHLADTHRTDGTDGTSGVDTTGGTSRVGRNGGTTITTRCGQHLTLGDTARPVERVEPGQGVPCTPCLLRSH
ncbi:hypothetical protein FHR81_005584 [Actinoalloteichus hoggarensis]|uniref:Uncharacterized protein n=1 Tax=Actinoalloteichus hoggarensis TaxID=1470176 RepID=A0A221W8B3_9PSEU|nr:hypothetical protein [Actinoalloteichus hoggarensis]ASO21953.1 hypothetical protein AHOG_21685 [Actinoalloteichus hoggarensis]MBB5924499.1 hypothetical protein [Actinoalloteichus hoggarensis]